MTEGTSWHCWGLRHQAERAGRLEGARCKRWPTLSKAGEEEGIPAASGETSAGTARVISKARGI